MLLSQEEISSMSVGEQKRYQLQLQIICLLYQSGVMTAAALSKKLNLSLPTIRGLLEGLMGASIVLQVGDSCKSGRKPFNYQLSESAFYVFVVEVGHSHSRCAIINCLNQLVGEIQVLPVHMDDPDFESLFSHAFMQMASISGVDNTRVSAVGISMPGLIDSAKGVNNTIGNEAKRDVAGRLKKMFKKPVFVENDARMNALGELVFGMARGKQNVMVVNWNDGLGLGIVVDGRIISGSDGFAGEFSHIRIVRNGELCQCGKCGCLQTIASANYLLTLAKDAIAQNHTSHLTAQFHNCLNELTVPAIIEMAQRGDELSLSLLRQVSENLAWGLSILIQLNNPELIVINGPLAKAGELIKMPVLLALNQYCLRDISKQVSIEISSHDDGYGLSGVAVMIFNKMFSVS
ncbi:MAG: ROK family protein [Breznakibacter sp.]